MQQVNTHQTWSSPWVFTLAAIGSAVGLGNIWRFPYLAGMHGGGAFVLMYVISVAAMGIPILMAELLIGRRGRHSPVNTMRTLARQEGRSENWRFHGWAMLVITIFANAFFSVIGGWTLAYAANAARGSFVSVTVPESQAILQALLDNPWTMTLWHAVFMAFTVVIVAGGLSAGLERAIKVLMPTLFLILVVLVVSAAVTGDFAAGVRYLLVPDFSKLNAEGMLTALGQAFVSISVGVGVMLTYGAYLPQQVSIPGSAVIVVAADTLVALLAGLAIFPIVLGHGLALDQGPGLIFVTLPIAFGQMPGGSLLGTLFFVLFFVAALTSAIGLLQVLVTWLGEKSARPTWQLALSGGIAVWLLGLAPVLSFNVWSEVRPLSLFALFEDQTIFGLLEYFTANVMTPLSGLLLAVFAGWCMATASTRSELGMKRGATYTVWHFLIRYFAPVAVVIIFLVNLV
jgi:NSS family neurotransmitter:Na+ symporter